jgi:hypothetical protein
MPHWPKPVKASTSTRDGVALTACDPMPRTPQKKAKGADWRSSANMVRLVRHRNSSVKSRLSHVRITELMRTDWRGWDEWIRNRCSRSNARTKAKAINCSSLPPFRHHHDTMVASVPYNVTSASAVCSSSINAPHEYFDPTTNAPPSGSLLPDTASFERIPPTRSRRSTLPTHLLNLAMKLKIAALCPLPVFV